MPLPAAELALVAVADDARTSPAREPQRVTRASGPGWFDSSWELQRGLEVREGWSADDQLHGWIETFLAAQRTCARTASPSASTAIA